MDTHENSRSPVIRGVLRRLRHLPDRWLHALRRRRALREVRIPSPGGRVVVLCHGNICRSPYAAAVLRRRLRSQGLGRVEVTSAGFVGPGRTSPPTAIRAAAQRGVDLSDHRSRLATIESVGAADLVLVMESRQRRLVRRTLGRRGATTTVLHLGDFDPGSIRRRDIRDPVESDLSVFQAVYRRIDRCVEPLVARAAAGATASGAPCRGRDGGRERERERSGERPARKVWA